MNKAERSNFVIRQKHPIKQHSGKDKDINLDYYSIHKNKKSWIIVGSYYLIVELLLF